MYIQNGVYYHIHVYGKKHDSLWYVGSQFEVGGEKNFFLEYYEDARIGLHFSGGYKDIEKGFDYAPDEIIPIRESYYKLLPNLASPLKDEANKVWLKQALKAIKEMGTYIREVIFEEVRIESFPECPSRKTSLWLTDKEHINHWIERTHAEVEKRGKEVFKVSVTGNIHMGNGDEYLNSDTISHKELRENAIKYWSGEGLGDNVPTEILFEGSVKVLEKFEDPKK